MRTKKFIIAFALILAMGVFGLGATTVFAQESLQIGIGAENKATVTVTNENSQVLTVANGVTQGQYFIYADVTSPETDYYRINPYVWLGEYYETTSEEEEPSRIYYYLDYNEQLGLYYTMIETSADKQITVYAAYYNEEGDTVIDQVTMDLYLGNLALGDFNLNSLYGVKTPAKIAVNNVAAGKYILAVTPETEITGNITARVDEEEVTLQVNEQMFGAYTAEITLTETSEFLYIDTADLTVSVTLYTYKTAEPLPDGDIAFTSGESKIFSFTPAEEGYHTLNIAYNEEVAMFTAMLKTDPNALDGEYMEIGYPTYLNSGTEYYLDISCYIWDETTTTTNARISFAQYTVPTLVPNEIAYIPTSASYKLPLTAGVSGTYSLHLLNVPYDVETVALHYGEGENEKVVNLNNDNNFSADIDLTNIKEIYFVATPVFVAGVLIEEKTENYDLKLDTATPISLAVDESLTYYLTDLPVGYYSITLSYTDGTTVKNVSVMDYEGNVLVPTERGFGLFDATIYDPDPETQVIPVFGLTFTNMFDDSKVNVPQTFTVTVSSYVPTVLNIGSASQLSVEANSVVGCVFTASDAGIYDISVSGNGKTVVWTVLDGVIIAAGSTSGEITVEAKNKVMFIFFENMGDAETITVTIE